MSNHKVFVIRESGKPVYKCKMSEDLQSREILQENTVFGPMLDMLIDEGLHTMKQSGVRLHELPDGQNYEESLYQEETQSFSTIDEIHEFLSKIVDCEITQAA